MTKIILPDEIIDHILSFSPQHRESFKPTLQQLEDVYFRRIIRKIRRQYLDTDMSNLNLMLNNIGKTELYRWYDRESSILTIHNNPYQDYVKYQLVSPYK